MNQPQNSRQACSASFCLRFLLSRFFLLTASCSPLSPYFQSCSSSESSESLEVVDVDPQDVRRNSAGEADWVCEFALQSLELGGADVAVVGAMSEVNNRSAESAIMQLGRKDRKAERRRAREEDGKRCGKEGNENHFWGKEAEEVLLHITVLDRGP